MAGRDPDQITIGDWCDVAWAYLMRTSSAMMNPFEFRETMWTVLYEGERPAPKVQAPTPTKRGGRKALPKPGPARPIAKRDIAALQAFEAEILAIKERRQSSDGDAAKD